ARADEQDHRHGLTTEGAARPTAALLRELGGDRSIDLAAVVRRHAAQPPLDDLAVLRDEELLEVPRYRRLHPGLRVDPLEDRLGRDAVGGVVLHRPDRRERERDVVLLRAEGAHFFVAVLLLIERVGRKREDLERLLLRL